MKDKETLYARWLNDEISEEELEFLRKDGAIEDLEKIIEATASMSLPKYDKVEGLNKLKARGLPTKTKSKKSNLLWIVGIALLLLLVVGLYSYFNQDTSQIMIAGNGVTKNLSLVDGSSIVVNDGSSVKYNNETWLDNRSIELKGEAFFEVEKGTPFVVKTKNGSIEVLGTQFNVRSWGAGLTVECYEGSVKVTAADKQSILQPSEVVYLKNGVLSEKETITNSSPLWTAGSSRFNDENVNEVFEEMERQYDITIDIPEMSKRFSGVFNHNDLDSALQNICKPLDLSYSISADKKTVIIE